MNTPDEEKAPVLKLEAVPYHTLPPENEEVNIDNRTGCVIPSGALIVVGDVEGGVHISMHNPISDTQQSVLSFKLTDAAAVTLTRLLLQKFDVNNHE